MTNHKTLKIAVAAITLIAVTSTVFYYLNTTLADKQISIQIKDKPLFKAVATNGNLTITYLGTQTLEAATYHIQTHGQQVELTDRDIKPGFSITYPIEGTVQQTVTFTYGNNRQVNKLTVNVEIK
jgi:hypothetical protein